MRVESKKRRLATIKEVFYGLEDHGINTCYVTLNFVNGGTQSFGGLNLNANDSGSAFLRALCSMFKVPNIESLPGKACWALFCFGEHNEVIEGIQTIDTNEKLTLTGFCRRFDKNIPSRLERVGADLKNEINRLQKRLASIEEELKTVENRYTDWEVET